MSFIEVDNVTRIFATEHEPHVALKEVSFKLKAGTTLAVCGPSGSGKSTLLGLLGGLDRPSEGTITVAGQEVSHLSAGAEATYRNTITGFVFQFHHLLRDFNILENVMMPLLIRGGARRDAIQRAREILSKVGLADFSDRRPGELSGGEQQRAAIARALVHAPQLVLADEPTGNLDEASGTTVFDLLCHLNRDLRCALVVVTHHEGFARRMDAILRLKSGRVESITPNRPQ